jgi:hypothetical protein
VKGVIGVRVRVVVVNTIFKNISVIKYNIYVVWMKDFMPL